MDTTNFGNDNKETLQTFVMTTSGHYKLGNKKVYNTNFCIDKKQTLQLF